MNTTNTIKALNAAALESPVERLAEALNSSSGLCVGEILVPEQCLELYIDGKAYHVSIQEI